MKKVTTKTFKMLQNISI